MHSFEMRSVTKRITQLNINQTYAVLFWLNKSKANKKVQVPVWVRITIDGKRAECATAIKIFPEQWDTIKGTVKSNFQEAQSINEHLENVRVGIRKHYNILLTTRPYVSAIDVKNSYCRSSNKLLPINSNAR